jgi:hypothetical protein
MIGMVSLTIKGYFSLVVCARAEDSLFLLRRDKVD